MKKRLLAIAMSLTMTLSLLPVSEKPNGNLPLMCRITVDGEIKQFSCKMDVPKKTERRCFRFL